MAKDKNNYQTHVSRVKRSGTFSSIQQGSLRCHNNNTTFIQCCYVISRRFGWFQGPWGQDLPYKRKVKIGLFLSLSGTNVHI